jgi:hypothetical protein
MNSISHLELDRENMLLFLREKVPLRMWINTWATSRKLTTTLKNQKYLTFVHLYSRNTKEIMSMLARSGIKI